MPKLVDHVNYRKHLLEQCVDLFARYGYEALTMRQIAEALHVSTGTLYYYFPTKETLFQHLVEEVTQQIVFEATTLVQQQATLEERLSALFHFIAQHEDVLRKQLLISLNYYQHRDLSGKAAGEILKEGAGRYRRAIMELLGLRDPQLCFLLQSQINGLFMLRMLNGPSIPFEEQARPYITMLVDYLRKEAGSEVIRTESVQESEHSEEE
ncbi:MAG TPA: TetR/AcrR family transcriptional regulator [Ktedonobacteraceae bacterium]